MSDGPETHLFVLLPTGDIRLPPHMTSIQDRRGLMTLFQQLATVERSFRNQRIVIIRPKHSTRLESRYDTRNRLQLGPGFGYRFFVNNECLD
jgi:hypothetical protein